MKSKLEKIAITLEQSELLKKVPILADVIAKDDQSIYTEMNAVTELILPNGEKIYYVQTPSHGWYYNKKSYLGEEDDGLDFRNKEARRVASIIVNYSLNGKAVKEGKQII